MTSFEGTQNLNSSESNSTEKLMDNSTTEKLEDELVPGESKRVEEGREIEKEQEVERSGLSSEDHIKNLEGELESRQQEVIRLTKSVEGTKVRLNESRERLGLPQTKEYPSSIVPERDKLEKLQTEQEVLEKQKEEIINQKEKERLIQEERRKIMQEKLDGVFKEFEMLNSNDFESIFRMGKMHDGGKVESSSMGRIDSDTAKSLAIAFKEGIKLLPKILEEFPKLLEKFDEDLTKEATDRVDKRLEEEIQNMEEEQKEEKNLENQKPESSGVEPSTEASFESNQVDGGDAKTH